MKKLIVEYRKDFKPSKDTLRIGGALIMFTPDISEDYWLMRVKLYRNQSVIAFPKFGTIGIGFAQESNWNTNLPYDVPAERLYNHIEINKKYNALTKEQCIEAIKLLQEACKKYEVKQPIVLNLKKPAGLYEEILKAKVRNKLRYCSN